MKKVLGLVVLIFFISCFSVACFSPSADFKNDLYELSTPPYQTIYRSALEPFGEIKPNRFQLSQSGVYENINADKSNTATLMFTGDLMCQGRQQNAAYKNETYDFNNSFDCVKDVFSSADFVVGNLETMLSETAPFMSESKSVDGLPHCNAPNTYLDALKYAGFDAVVTSNNHNCDVGYQGITETLAHLDNYDLMHTGLFKDANATRHMLVDINGIKVGVLSYSEKFNGKQKYYTEYGQQVCLNIYSKERVTSDIAELRAVGAEFIVVYNHNGTEYTHVVNNSQKKSAQEIADAGADYIIYSHPHVLQEYDVLHNAKGEAVPVVYSMGNFISHMKETNRKQSIILQVKLARQEGKIVIEKEGYIPVMTYTRFNNRDYVVVPLVSPYNDGMTSDLFESSASDIIKVMGNKIFPLGS